MNYNQNCPVLPWMIDFHSTDQGQVLNNQFKAAFANTTLEYLSGLTIKSKPPVFKATQLVCTITPHTSCRDIEEFLNLGMSVAVIKSQPYNKEKILETISKLKTLVNSYSRKIGRIYPLALTLEITGPQIRIGQLKDDKQKIHLEKGRITSLTTDPSYEDYVNEDIIFIDYEKLPDIIQPGDKVHLHDGSITLSALEAAESIIRCIVDKAGDLISRASVSIPCAPIDLPTLADEDKELLNIAVENSIDVVICAGVSNREGIYEIRQLLGDEGGKIQVVAKIENASGVENINEILSAADGICINCDRLMHEIPKEKVFLVQKSILAKCNLNGKPSMSTVTISNIKCFTKPEIDDIANVIIDGADSLYLNEDCCTGEAIKNISNICKEAEPAIYQKLIFNELSNNLVTPGEAIYCLCVSTVEASLKSNAAAIICLTSSGRTAKLLSRFKPRCPIITITRYPRVARMLRIYRGVDPIVYLREFDGIWERDVERRVQLGVTYGKIMGLIRMGDAVVTVTGSRPDAGIPNLMKIVYASDYDTIQNRTKYKPKIV